MAGDLGRHTRRAAVDRAFESAVLPALCAYTAIPCLSPAFDPEWSAHGHIDRAAADLAAWCRSRPVPGLVTEVLTLPGRTPVLLAEAPGDDPAAPTVLVYGHLDKQPPLGEWRAGLSPFTAVREGDLLYGRGTADDGYSVFAAVTALELLAAAGVPRPRVVVLIEASEESGSPDLDAHLDAWRARIGRPGLVVCLDSGALSYDRLWLTTSLRGNLVATVRVDVLTEGVHSGLAAGVAPSSFRLARQLVSRLEDERTGEIRLDALTVDVPPDERRHLADAAASVEHPVRLPTVEGLALPDPAEALVARAWSPALSVTGVDGIPATGDGGNVALPFTTLKLSVRLPPTVDAGSAARALVTELERDPPEGARVRVEIEHPAQGWRAPELEPWVADALERASTQWFGRGPGAYGEGGSIPFLADLGRRFPGVQMVATGVLGPGSNAHGPNECLHLPMAGAVTAALAHLLAAAPTAPR
ncbi:MAG TPA: M20/M25/M40 family metallo-hydrolase [Acidimicrobiales bacterium]|nr:M20/M25/M40 family metallo-hydrolase [Acidimicrobiales bacterium]